MIRVFLMALIALFSLTSSCACETVPAGNVGVLVHKMGSDRGEIEVVGIGLHFVNPFSDNLFVFPTFKQTEQWTGDQAISFQTKEGLSVSADVGMTYSVQADHAGELFKTYRRGIGEISDLFLRNHVRDELNKIAATLPVEAVYGEGKADMIAAVTEGVRKVVSPLGITLDSVYLIGSVHLPPTVVDALNAKLTATQRAQQRENELRESEAEAKKNVAIARGRAEAVLAEAEAQAKANALLAESMTPNLIKAKEIEAQARAVDKWDGKLPVVSGSGGSVVPLPASLLTP